MSLKARCNYDNGCGGYPFACGECAIVKYVKDDVRTTNALASRAREILKDETMNNNITVTIGNLTYRATDVDFIQTADAYPMIDIRTWLAPSNKVQNLSITNVIFNPPATIVFWSDNTKTVVKARGEFYDPEKGIAMAISKKMLGDNKYEYYYLFEHWLKKWNKQSKDENHD